MNKLGLIAGGGGLPVTLAEHCRGAGRPFFVLRLRGFAGPELDAFPGEAVGLAELGKAFAVLKREGCEAVCMSGNVDRPDFSKLKPDLRGLKALPGAILAAREGDDALLRFVLGEFEREGFAIEGAEAVAAGLILAAGPLGALATGTEHHADIALALKVVQALGALDVGQAAVVAQGVTLAVEAQEGTDNLLQRCVALPAALKGTADARLGVLVKWPKPAQDRRIDLPVVGVKTVEGAAAAGLAGIVVQAGQALAVDKDAVRAAADRLGLFVVGLDSAP